MKKLTFTALFMLCGVSSAQPPVQSNAAQNPPNWNRGAPVRWNAADTRAENIRFLAGAGPASVAEFFLNSAQAANWDAAALAVAGVQSDSPALLQLQLIAVAESPVYWAFDLQRTQAENVRTQALQLKDDEIVEVVVTLVVADAFGVQLRGEEKVTLRRELLTWPKGLAHEAGSARAWRIVPPEKTDEEKAFGPLKTYALMLSNSSFGVRFIGRQVSVSQARQISLGVMQFLQDWNEKYDLDETNWREKLMPYLKDETLFTAPNDANKTNSYRFNAKLSGKKMSDVKNAAQTVLFYLGKDEKPDFRYGRKATVAYADGHVELVSADQQLRWEP